MRLSINPRSEAVITVSVQDNAMAGVRSVEVRVSLSGNMLAREGINPSAVTNLYFTASDNGEVDSRFVDFPGPYPVRRLTRTQEPRDMLVTYLAAAAIPLPPTRGSVRQVAEAVDLENTMALSDPEPEAVLSFVREFYPQPFTVPVNLSNPGGAVSGHMFIDAPGDVLRLQTIRGDFLQVPLSSVVAALLDHDMTRNVSQQLPTEPRRHRRRTVRGET